MKGESSGTLFFGGEVAKKHIEHLTDLCGDELSCDFPDDVTEGYCEFYDCCSDSMKPIVDFCKENHIALKIEWSPQSDGGGFIEYYLPGEEEPFRMQSDADGNLMVSVDWLMKQVEQNSECTVKQVLSDLSIPTFPEFKEV